MIQALQEIDSRSHKVRFDAAAVLGLCLAILFSPFGAAAEDFELVEVPFDHAAFGLVEEREYLPSKGRVNALVVFAQFADEAHKGDGVPDYAVNLFDPDYPGSFTHFYDTMSFGQLEVRGKVLEKRYTAEQGANAYLVKGRMGRFGLFAEEILRRVDTEVDLGLFDNDGPDGSPNSGDDDGVGVALQDSVEWFLG